MTDSSVLEILDNLVNSVHESSTSFSYMLCSAVKLYSASSLRTTGLSRMERDVNSICSFLAASALRDNVKE